MLTRYVVETMQNHYPETFERITVTPASWFFQTCFRLTSNVFEARVKERFHLIPTAQAEAHLESMFPKGAFRGRQMESSIQTNPLSSTESTSFSHSWIRYLFLNAALALELRHAAMFLWKANKSLIGCFKTPSHVLAKKYL